MSPNEAKANFYRRIGHNIAFLRKERDIKQDSLAMTLNVSQATISQYESATRIPSIERLFAIAEYFNVPIQDLMFGDFKNERAIGNQKSSVVEATDPITNCCKSTFYVYFLKENAQNRQTSVASLTLRVDEPESSHSAKATVSFFGDKGLYPAQLTMDESYAYIDMHNYNRDFYMHLVFYYYRNKKSFSYNGGLGMLQHFDFKNNPIAQFCVISRNQIAHDKKDDLRSYLKFECVANQPNYKQMLSSDSIIRLTKSKDAALFDWLKRNKYTIIR